MTNIKFDFIDEICLKPVLETYDPYDIWKTNLGLKVKNLFNSSKVIGGGPALAFTLFDLLLNNNFRIFYKKQEYPIVRALSCQILLNRYKQTENNSYLNVAKDHLKWLEKNSSKGYSGFCWGLGFKWPAQKNVVYDANTPHVTHTPYVLEAFHKLNLIQKSDWPQEIIKSSFQFFENDLQVMFEDDRMLAVSYGPFKDRVVTNAVSYAMFSYSIFYSYFPEKELYIKNKIIKLFNFIKASQNSDGSWLYTPDDEHSFIDCFHSCFVVKNLIKTRKIIELDGVEKIINDGYGYICDHFIDKKKGLYKRFTKENKLSLTSFDLYDNAEVLNLAYMLGDKERKMQLEEAIKHHFIKGKSIYSIIDIIGKRRNKNMLRWAVMPYLYTQSL